MKQGNRNLKIALGVIALAVIALIIVVVVKSPTTQNIAQGDQSAPASLLKQIENIPDSVFSTVGLGTAGNKPKKLNAPALTVNNKPELLYMGAEFCPYCATERWSMVIALSKFGQFSNLGLTHSSSTDVYANTKTFTFHGSTYTSQYLTFVPVEQYTNQPLSSGSYQPLDKPTTQEQNLINKYDAPPYVSSQSTGSIPFIDFGGMYEIVGATYSPQVLQGLSYNQIASKLQDPTSSVAKGAIGSANMIIATICKMTNNQPNSVCGQSYIVSIESQL